MTLAHGRSLLAGTVVVDQPYTPDDDAASLRRLAEWMLRFAPVVSADGADGLMLDIAGCQHLFGGEREQVRKIDRVLCKWGIQPRLAVAPTVGCAWAVARFGKERVSWIAEENIEAAMSPLPIQALRIHPKIIEALADVGIERIEHLWSLPRDELVARFGNDLIRRLDQATGAVDETISPLQPGQPIEASRQFDGPVKRIEIIELALRKLLTDLMENLRNKEKGVLALAFELRRVDVQPVGLTIRLTHPNRDHKHLWSLLGPRLERVNLGFGVEEIVLRAVRTAPLPTRQASFLREAPGGDSHDHDALGELVDRFADRLGVSAVTRVQAAETYVPERAFVHAPVRDMAQTNSQISNLKFASRAKRREIRRYAAHRPSELFDKPESARVISLVPDGPPAWIEWQGQSAEIVTSLGPERIAFPWWTSEQPAIRDYYEIEDRHGRLLWIYRDVDAGGWFVHGQWI